MQQGKWRVERNNVVLEVVRRTHKSNSCNGSIYPDYWDSTNIYVSGPACPRSELVAIPELNEIILRTQGTGDYVTGWEQFQAKAIELIDAGRFKWASGV